MNLILLEPSELTTEDEESPDKKFSSSAVLPLSDARCKHILHHLRKKTGDSVLVGVLGIHGKHTAQITLADSSLKLSFQQEEVKTQTPHPQITLILALPFPARLKYLWAVIASMGVPRIMVVKAQLSNEEHAKSRALQPTTYNALIREGLSQGGHTHWPEVIVDLENPLQFDKLQNQVPEWNAAAKLFLDCGDETTIPPSVRTVVQQQERTISAIVAVGPERGWTDEEANLFSRAGFQPALLGPSILRVDTAVVAGIAQIQAALQEVLEQKQPSTAGGARGDGGGPDQKKCKR